MAYFKSSAGLKEYRALNYVTSTSLRLGKQREDCLYYDDSKLRRERGSEGSLETKYASTKRTGARDSVLAKLS